MGKVGAIWKDRKNEAQGYKFRGIDDMYNALNEHLAEEKVFFTSEVLSTSREERATKSGGVLMYSIITMKFTAYAEDGSSVSSTTVGEAMDSWDKSMNKAMSTAYKYALMQIFCIPTEDDKDTENKTHEPIARTQNTPTGSITKNWLNFKDLKKAIDWGTDTEVLLTQWIIDNEYDLSGDMKKCLRTYCDSGELVAPEWKK